MSRKPSRLSKQDQTKLRKKAAAITWAGANFLSGTVSPAKANATTNDIEDFSHAIQHYAKRGVEHVILQVKDMGSRATAYLYRDREQCFFSSRGGFKLTREQEGKQAEIEAALDERWNFWFGEDGKAIDEVVHIIEDGELCPWHLTAESLIDREFVAYMDSGIAEINQLRELGFEETGLYTAETFAEEKRREKDLKHLVAHTPLCVLDEEWAKFRAQLDIFGKPGETYYSPFNILKVCYADGTESIVMDNNLDNYAEVGKHPFVVIATGDLNHLTEIEEFREFMQYLTDKQLEGIMVKPCTYEREVDRATRYAPYIKVRNPEYLRLIYGFDYQQPAKLEKLIQRKSIGGKVGASITQYELGRKMLELPYTTVMRKEGKRPTEEHFQAVLSALTSIELGVQTLDPRL